MKYKLGLFVNYTKKVFRTPSRIILTLSGLVLSVVILMLGLIFSGTYLDSEMADIEMYNEYSAVEIDGDVDYELYEKVKENARFSNIELISGYKYNVKSIIINNKEVDIYIKDIRTDKMLLSFLNKDSENTSRYRAELKQGRLINTSDVENENNVVVIGETLAYLMYGNKNPIGQKMMFPIYKLNEESRVMEVDYYEELQVVGVITDSDYEKECFEHIGNEKIDDNELEMIVYVPLSYKVADKKMEDYSMRITASYLNNEYYENALKCEQFSSDNGNGSHSVYSYYSMKDEISKEIDNIRTITMYIVIFMFFISGICIVNTMFFSVKERINEIGIRKSIGADDEDIIIQFVYEGMIYGVLASLIGIAISVVVASCIYIVLAQYNIWKANLHISIDIMMLAFFSSVIIGTIAGIIPAIYASKIKIVDAIKYE